MIQALQQLPQHCFVFSRPPNPMATWFPFKVKRVLITNPEWLFNTVAHPLPMRQHCYKRVIRFFSGHWLFPRLWSSEIFTTLCPTTNVTQLRLRLLNKSSKLEEFSNLEIFLEALWPTLALKTRLQRSSEHCNLYQSQHFAKCHSTVLTLISCSVFIKYCNNLRC